VRASSAYALSLCPGKARLERGQPDIQSAEAAQGTRLAGYRANKEWDRRLLPPAEQDLLRIADKLERQIFEIIGLEGAYIEKREVAMEWGDGLVTGHPDLIRIYTELDTSIVIDDKFGWTRVPAADVNLQLRCYAIMAPTKIVYAAIAQPRLQLNDRITIARYDEEAKAQARAQIVEILRASEAEDGPLVPGEEQCRYCLARSFCPALREAVTKALILFEQAASPELSKAASLDRVDDRLAQASDSDLGRLFAACALARLVSPPLGDEIRRRIQKGGMMEGWELGKEVEVRTIPSARRAISLLVLNGVLTREQILERCDLSIGEVEQEYRKQTGSTAKAAKEEINRILADAIEIEKRKPRIISPR